jgi:S-adenosylmethionine hydrolase
MAGYDWISFTTDYGLSDGFVAACHGVIARLAPTVRVIDVTHLISPADVSHASVVLAQAVPHLPPAVHIAVVDPGVGTARRAVAVETAESVFVGPDNGLLPAAADAVGGPRRAYVLDRPDWFAATVSPTFHGRDVFAPVGARLAAGGDITDVGTEINPDTLVRLPEPVVLVGDDWLEAEVAAVDRFGNVQLAAPASALDRLGELLRVGGVTAHRAVTFGDAKSGALVVYADSADRVAVAINGGRAVVALGVTPGDVLRITSA